MIFRFLFDSCNGVDLHKLECRQCRSCDSLAGQFMKGQGQGFGTGVLMVRFLFVKIYSSV